MYATLKFLGASQNVTGSKYLLEVNGSRILIDCGFFQEREFQGRNWDEFAVPPATIDVVLLTHAHLDHCGLLPKLVKEGFSGRVIGTAATLDIADIIMRDSGRIQEEDADFKKRRHEREGRVDTRAPKALYTLEDAEKVKDLFVPVKFGKREVICEGVEATWHIAGHILGAASIELVIRQGEETRTVVFSGDIGRDHAPLLQDPTRFDGADYLIMESTYADRDHPKEVNIEEELERVILKTIKQGGNLVIPSFAVERSQDLLYHLSHLRKQSRIPQMMVFVDSPMAINVTEVFMRHPDLFDEETRERLRNGTHPCNFPGLVFTRAVSQSKAINQIRGSAIIIAGSGMCTGGRIKHHLAANLEREESTILFVGYQANGTLGRIILEGAPRVRILGQEREVKAHIEKINGFSGHAGRSELMAWFDALKKPPRKTFVTHGDAKNALAWAAFLRDSRGADAVAPEYEQEFELT